MNNLLIYRFNDQLQATIRQGLADGIPEYVMQYILKDAFQAMSGMANAAVQKEAREEQERINAVIKDISVEEQEG